MPTTSRGTGCLRPCTARGSRRIRSGGPSTTSRSIVDGDRIVLGHVALDVLHTPGHRPEHCCIAIADLERGDEPWILLTGDSLFVGDVARPDLAVAGAEGAEGLFRSLHGRLAALGDGVEVFPGHVAGSLCGRAMSSRTSTTLGFERQHNDMLAEMSQDRFVRLANENLAPKPPTMARVVELNRGPLIEREPVARMLDRVPDDAQLLDVRPAADVAAGHLAGAIGIPVDVTGFANRAGFVLDPEREVTVLAASEAEAAYAVRLLAAVGFDRIALVEGGLPAGAALERFRVADAGDLDDPELQVLDVREQDEQDEIVPGAVCVPYRDLVRRRPRGARSRATGRDRVQLGRPRGGRGDAARSARVPRRPPRAPGRHGRLPGEGL